MSERTQYGFSLTIFLPDGESDGLRLVEKSNWTGLGVVCPRASYRSAKTRREFTRTGVYILSGPPEPDGTKAIYVGEGETIRPRLDQHILNKDFWSSAIFFVSKDDNLNKAHVQYLESRLIGLATEAKKCELHNSVVPKLPSLSEAGIADVEAFLAEVLLCLPVLGLDVFERPHSRREGEVELYLKGKDAEGRGYETPTGIVVRVGSRARRDETPSLSPLVRASRARLLAQGVMTDSGEYYEFVQDYEFSSPSAAADTLLGRSANGRTEWRDADGRTLKDIQEAEIREA